MRLKLPWLRRTQLHFQQMPEPRGLLVAPGALAFFKAAWYDLSDW